MPTCAVDRLTDAIQHCLDCFERDAAAKGTYTWGGGVCGNAIRSLDVFVLGSVRENALWLLDIYVAYVRANIGVKTGVKRS